ncbi:hypothetical protein FJV46_07650 [Arthrobacter agilis]|uniref:septum site-determining protein Ssd n=1 Tax=Arthrobacter agilis TaxID=37921 RepID=UPI000B34B37B|nr:septum site-determining protein Ssd [Arthrobacter agilis]OUM43023.1 hypothetical protein B8W74_07180 [Arthrobacter agilis]PPB45968.1 hypothetical protein CI784_09375 [Arthrobacter agilis]TPV25508.1 hypothetical protein FJV46_07650 [Arthrobacter agilis]VDR33258.1 Flp pilus assembly protein, ATPase CpaE [Arthrobacter agilis]
MTQKTWLPDDTRRLAVLAGGSEYIQDQVARSCAAAGVRPVFVPGMGEALALNPTVLLVTADQAVERLPGAHDVVVVASADDEARAWGTAVHFSSSRVVVLPQGGGWLAEYLGGRMTTTARGTLIGFVGAVGGCGISSLAFWCALGLTAGGTATLLVDGPSAGGGLDLALGTEELPGVRWHDLTDVRGSLNSEHLRSALPAAGRLSLLSHGAPGVPAGQGEASASVEAVLEAARGAFPMTLVDLGCGMAARPWAGLCDGLVLLVPSRQRGVAAAEVFVEEHSLLPVAVVLRGPVADGLDAWRVAELIGRPEPLAHLPFVRDAASVEARGGMLDAGIPRRARKAVAAVTRTIEQFR